MKKDRIKVGWVRKCSLETQEGDGEICDISEMLRQMKKSILFQKYLFSTMFYGPMPMPAKNL